MLLTDKLKVDKRSIEPLSNSKTEIVKLLTVNVTQNTLMDVLVSSAQLTLFIHACTISIFYLFL